MTRLKILADSAAMTLPNTVRLKSSFTCTAKNRYRRKGEEGKSRKKHVIQAELSMDYAHFGGGGTTRKMNPFGT